VSGTGISIGIRLSAKKIELYQWYEVGTAVAVFETGPFLCRGGEDGRRSNGRGVTCRCRELETQLQRVPIVSILLLSTAISIATIVVYLYVIRIEIRIETWQ
jgi:hypothetical protein